MRLRGRRLALVPKRKPGEVVVTFVVDTTAFQQALSRAAEGLGAMVATLNRLAYGQSPQARLAARRAAEGGNGSDARNWPDLWLSTACSVWLCRAEPWSCPDARGAGLQCHCRCHQRAAVTTRRGA